VRSDDKEMGPTATGVVRRTKHAIVEKWEDIIDNVSEMRLPNNFWSKIGNLNRTKRTAHAFMQQQAQVGQQSTQALALMAQALRPQPAPLLLSVCANCGAAAVQPGSKFCLQCGAAQ
jgi:hypothetical protein